MRLDLNVPKRCLMNSTNHVGDHSGQCLSCTVLIGRYAMVLMRSLVVLQRSKGASCGVHPVERGGFGGVGSDINVNTAGLWTAARALPLACCH